VEVVDALLEFGVAGKIAEHLEIRFRFLRLEDFKEVRGGANMSKIALERLLSILKWDGIWWL
jgi:hypothetical protein